MSGSCLLRTTDRRRWWVCSHVRAGAAAIEVTRYQRLIGTLTSRAGGGHLLCRECVRQLGAGAIREVLGELALVPVCRRCRLPRVVGEFHDAGCTWHPSRRRLAAVLHG